MRMVEITASLGSLCRHVDCGPAEQRRAQAQRLGNTVADWVARYGAEGGLTITSREFEEPTTGSHA